MRLGEGEPAVNSRGDIGNGVAPPGVVAHTAPDKTSQGNILVIDIGGTKVKMLATGKTKPHKFLTGPTFNPEQLMALVRKLDDDWNYAAVTIGFPGLVGAAGPKSEPGNLGPGWVGFDYASAFEAPVKIVNDAVMQALGSYDGGRMVFIGLGTGVGSALISEHFIVPLELSHLPFDGRRTFNDMLSRRGLRRLGKRQWRKAIDKMVAVLLRAFVADYVVLGGGNSKNIKELPVGARLGHNLTAFLGGFRLWSPEDSWAIAEPDGQFNRSNLPANPTQV
jgi:predicted NBD/HSP70 family sugar kinase